MSEAAQTGLDASDDDGHIGEELLEDARIDDGGVFGTEVVATVGRVGILRAQSLVGRVFVHHRVHRPRRNGEEESRTSQLLEVAVVAMPVGLGNDGHPQALRLKYASDDRRREGWVVNVSVAGEDDDIEGIPAEPLDFFFGGGEEGHYILFKEGEECTGEGVDGLVVGDAFERETETDEAMLLGDGGAVAVGVGEDGDGTARWNQHAWRGNAVTLRIHFAMDVEGEATTGDG